MGRSGGDVGMINEAIIRVIRGEDRAAGYCLETASGGEHGLGTETSGDDSGSSIVLRSEDE